MQYVLLRLLLGANGWPLCKWQMRRGREMLRDV